jgi:hypothetical protein
MFLGYLKLLGNQMGLKMFKLKQVIQLKDLDNIVPLFVGYWIMLYQASFQRGFLSLGLKK